MRIQECAPVSKLKSWTVLERIGAAPVAVDEIVEVDVSKPVTDPRLKSRRPRGKAKKAEPEAAEA